MGQGRKVYQLSIEEVKGILTAFAALMGIPATNMPQPDVMLMTINALIKNFGAMHEGEVKKAFEMAATGQLDIEEHYQSFSLKYICTVLNAYRVKVNNAMRFYENVRKEPTNQLEHKPEVDWTETLEDLKKNPNLPIPASMYDWMAKKGLVNHSKEEKQDAMMEAEIHYRQALHEKLMNGSARSQDKIEYEILKGEYTKKDPIHNRIANEAKKLLIKKYLNA